MKNKLAILATVLMATTAITAAYASDKDEKDSYESSSPITNNTNTATGGSVGNTSATVGNVSTGASTATVGAVGNNSGNSSNTNINSVSTKGTVGDISTSQGQGQGQSQSVLNSGNSKVSTNVSTKGTVGNVSSSSAGQTNEGNNSSNTTNVDASNNSVHQAQKRNPVSTAYAPALTATEDTCMGSTSVGAQGVGFGISLGSTWQDMDCVRRKDARELHNMQHRASAIALMCQKEDIRKAMEAAGDPCPGSEPKAVVNDNYIQEEHSSVTKGGYRNKAKEEIVTPRSLADRNFQYWADQAK